MFDVFNQKQNIYVVAGALFGCMQNIISIHDRSYKTYIILLATRMRRMLYSFNLLFKIETY